MSDNGGDDRSDKAGEENDRSYDIGYKRPPVATRFKDGHTGYGRDKAVARKSLPEEALDRLDKAVVVTENGKRGKKPSRRIAVKRLMGRALRGDARARGQIIRLATQSESHSAAVRPPKRPRWSRDRVLMYMEVLFRELVNLKMCNLLRDADDEERDELRLRDRSTAPPLGLIAPSVGSTQDRAISDNVGNDCLDEDGERNDCPYDVGYKRPPRASQFKKGHRGHRSGKTGARKSLGDEVREQLEEMVVVIENGERRKIHNRTALMDGLMADVLRGNARAVDQLAQLTKHAEHLRPSIAQRKAFKKQLRAVHALLVETVNKTALETFSNATPEEITVIRHYARKTSVEELRNTMTELRDRFYKYTLDEAKSTLEGTSLN